MLLWVMDGCVQEFCYTRGLRSWSHTTAFRSGGEKTCPLYRGKGRVKSFARRIGLLALNFKRV